MNIPAELFIKNRFKLVSKMKPGSALLLFGSDEMPKNGDQYYPFRQDSDFFYLTGIRQEKSALVLCPSHWNPVLREVLILIRPTPELETWNGYKLSPEEAAHISGIQKVVFAESQESILAEVFSASEKIYLNKPELPKFFPDVESRDERLGKLVRERFPYHEYLRAAPILRDLRSIKEEQEISCIKEAVRITNTGFHRVLGCLKPGMNEKEIEAELGYEFTRNKACHAFPPIVASGANACSLHYTMNNRQMQDGELLLIDFGAEFNYYAADCSRTIPVNGRYSTRQAEVYDGLLEVFKKAREIMKPGIRMEDVHHKVCGWMEAYHGKIGLYTGEELVPSTKQDPLWFKYYMHGTGHSVGLDVHDPYDKSAPLAPGMVFTCEPGVYIQQENLGIRLENDILITESGNIDLMTEIPLERKEIEALMKNR